MERPCRRRGITANGPLASPPEARFKKPEQMVRQGPGGIAQGELAKPWPGLIIPGLINPEPIGLEQISLGPCP